MKYHRVTINREKGHDLKNTVKIDNKLIKGIRNVNIKYGVDTGLPIVTIELYADILKSEIETSEIIKTKEKK